MSLQEPPPDTHGPRVTGLVGYPATYSLSPVMHNAGFRALGLPWVYTLFPVPPARLGAAVEGLRALGIAGFNVTIPHKQAIVPYLDELTPEAARSGAVNTVALRDQRLVGFNTDVEGFLRAMQEAGVELAGRRVLVLGAGGAARAVALACLRAGSARLAVAARRPERAQELMGSIGAQAVGIRTAVFSFAPDELSRAMRDSDVAVNATPLGTAGEGGEALAALADPGALPADGVAVDLVYRPAVTPWMRAAVRAGRISVGGAPMLLHQGALAFEIWTGHRAPLQAMRQALQAVLGAEAFAPACTMPGRAG